MDAKTGEAGKRAVTAERVEFEGSRAEETWGGREPDFRNLDRGRMPETAKNEARGFYDWHYDPDLLTLLLRNQTHHESAVKCKTETVVAGYRPHVNNEAFGDWLRWKALNRAVAGLMRQVEAEPERAAEIVRSIGELRDELATDERATERVQAFFDFLPSEVVYGAVHDDCYLGNCFYRFFRKKGEPDVIARVGYLFGRTMRVRIGTGFCQVIENEVRGSFPYRNVLHVRTHGPESAVYGTPGYLGSGNANRLYAAYDRLFLRFVKNGAHFGHLFVCNFDFDDRDTETGVSKREEELKRTILDAKGLGNGRNFYINLGGITDEGGKAPSLENVFHVKPLGELIQHLRMDTDGSENLRNNILSAHKVPPEILAAVTKNRVSGALAPIVELYNRTTCGPIQRRHREHLNSRLPMERWIDFDPYTVD